MLKIPVLLLVLLMASVAARADSSDMTRVLQTLVENDPTPYKEKMMLFIEAAKNEQTEKMLSLTSQITRDMYGDDSLRELYKTSHMPAFKMFPNMSEGGETEFMKGPDGTIGWIFRRIFSRL